MKKFLLTIFIIAASFSVRASDYPYLVFLTSDGTTHAMSVESLSINIEGSNMIITNNEETQTFVLTELTKMFFSDSATSVEEFFSSDGGEVAVYTLTGAHLGQFANAIEATKQLKSGVYLLRSMSTTIKIVVR